MADPSELLQQLRPLRAPPPDGTAEVLLMALVGCGAGALLTLAVLFWRARHRPLRRAALSALASARALPATERLAAQARMLRDLVGALDGGVAHLHGESWLTRLDAIFTTTLFSEGEGRAFGDALYRPRADDPSETLDRSLQKLLSRLDR
ncbi:hypothetical protein A1351_01065 [Methylosinus sp. R-45379]|uniref:DUF4381 domain-containing protein n=1 Tax=Methylosinus sp. R-45379 TaxID=980563 RepID=UPI0007C8F27B|nr:DUF4381 domain-containing protein [Methylosinus sp. R-45379]OAI29685.1 hypothetical protein A1351_01065 [Methylosinus sp. R-45379]